MAEIVVSLNNVTKKFKGVVAVDGVNLNLEAGKIYGLVGKNGAGKTTIMRMIAGLSLSSAGQVDVSVESMGTLIEAPALNGSMNAYENLKFFSMLSRKSQRKYTDDELLQLVGLEKCGRKKVKDFSLGMRQRLGIAVALLNDPDFIMLDEPVNGLDPIGVVEMRKLIKELNDKEQKTILISSHNLPELYQTATDFIIIDNGKVKKCISQEQLEKEHGDNLEEYFLSVIKEV